MVGKIILIVSFVFCSINVIAEENSYEKNCVQCHDKTPIKLDRCFNKYLLNNSNEDDTKKEIVKYLKNPNKNNTVMSDAVIGRHGVKEKSKLSEKELKEAVDIYWEKHQVSGKLK